MNPVNPAKLYLRLGSELAILRKPSRQVYFIIGSVTFASCADRVVSRHSSVRPFRLLQVKMLFPRIKPGYQQDLKEDIRAHPGQLGIEAWANIRYAQLQ